MALSLQTLLQELDQLEFSEQLQVMSHLANQLQHRAMLLSNAEADQLRATEHQTHPVNEYSHEDLREAWHQWFEETNRLEVVSSQPTTEFEELLVEKYRQQGLDL